MKTINLLLMVALCAATAFAPFDGKRAAAQCPAPWQWQNPLPQGNNLYSVYFPAPDTGYAVGLSGTILKTTFGGESLVIDSLTITKASCADTSCTDGSASVYTSGGAGALTYTWSNGGNSSTISNVYSATYTVTITDSNGCTITGSVLVDFLVSELNGLPVTGYWFIPILPMMCSI